MIEGNLKGMIWGPRIIISRGCKEESLGGCGFEGGLVTSGAGRASKVLGVWQQVVGIEMWV